MQIIEQALAEYDRLVKEASTAMEGANHNLIAEQVSQEFGISREDLDDAILNDVSQYMGAG